MQYCLDPALPTNQSELQSTFAWQQSQQVNISEGKKASASKLS
jgi:hypothetical protein